MRKKQIDWFALVPILLLLCIGLIMVLSASSPMTVSDKNRDAFSIFNKQAVWVGVGLVFLYLAANYNYRKLRKYVKPAAVITIFLLLVVFVFPKRGGAHGWIIIGTNQFQPSEFVKLCMVLILAKVMSTKGIKMSSFKDGLLPPLLFVVVVCGLVLLEPDLGSAVVIGITGFVMLYAGGANPWYLGILAGAGMGVVAMVVSVTSYQADRILAFLDPFKYPGTIGYQITQSLYAIGSGGLLGVGLGRSLQKFYYVPEQHTDFIFSILAEELGFIGAAFIILLFIFFAARGYRIARDTRDDFGSLLACGLTTIVITEAVINIAVVTSSMPVTGITLPFISYGGSSVIFKLLGVGTLLNVSRYVNRQDYPVYDQNALESQG